MFTNTEVITVFHKKINPEKRLPVWEKYLFYDVYWENCSAQSEENRGMGASNHILCIISEKSLKNFIPQKDDFIVRGNAESYENAEKFTVMYVKDFCYGSEKVRHIELTAK